jgi:hypothetical protein
MTTALVVRTTGDVETVKLPTEAAFLEIQKYVGGAFDCVYNNKAGIVAYVNDEGLLVGLEPNPAVSLVFGQLLVGDAVIVGIGENGEDGDVPQHLLGEDFSVRVMLASTDDELRQRLVAMRDNMDWTPQVVAWA